VSPLPPRAPHSGFAFLLVLGAARQPWNPILFICDRIGKIPLKNEMEILRPPKVSLDKFKKI